MGPSYRAATSSGRLHSRTPFLLCALLWLLTALPAPLLAQSLPGAGRGLLSAPAFLPVEEAFTWYTSLPEQGVVGVHWQIVEGHYLYRDKFRFALQVGETELELAPRMPDGSPHEDEFFGAVEVYFADMAVLLPLPGAHSAGAITLIIEYQGCAQAGLCYTPQRREITLEL